MQTLADFIDLERYPVDRLDSPAGCALVEDCRQMMSEGAICATIFDSSGIAIQDLFIANKLINLFEA